MKSPVVKRSIVVAGHKTSVSLEEAFWNGMKEISGLRNMTLSELVGEIDSNRQQGNLSSAIRLFVLDYFKSRAMAAIQAEKGPGPVAVFAPILDADPGADRLCHEAGTLKSL
ncbi:putative DNA-binding ribbon-helix-helix protein [Bradyrhizobium sp. GM22.5]